MSSIPPDVKLHTISSAPMPPVPNGRVGGILGKGGSGVVSRRLTGQSRADKFVMKIPNNKVGLVIGKGGETIKNMQANTGARIQVIPLHLPPGDTSTERTLQIDGTSEQIETAKQLVNDVIREDFQKSRISRSAMFPSVYNQPEDSFGQDVIATVEKSMKKYADNLMRFLEGISSRLSRLELCCYNLDKSIGEMRSELGRDHGEADSRLKSLEKHLQEVHWSVQILRDKQELAETQKELAKLQLAQKESYSSSHSQSSEEKTSSAAADAKKTDNTSDAHNQQLALALPHQVVPQQQPVAPPPQAPPQNLTQQQSYYLPPTQLPNPPAQTQHTHSQYPPDSQYRTPQLQDISRVAPQPTQSQVNQTAPVQPFPQYQQQWPQQLPQPSQQPSMQPQIRPPSTTVYSSYTPSQPTNPSPPETLPNSMPMQMPFPGIPQPVSTRVDAMPYAYSGAGRTVPQQPPPQQMKGTFGAQPGDGYVVAGPQAALPPGSGYMMYDSEGRAHHPPQPPHCTQGGYPPTSVALQNPKPTTGPNLMVWNPSHSQFFRKHPYSELIEKLVSMGFRVDHVASVIQRMEESGQPIDFNAVLDRLNEHSSGDSQRGWSG